MSISALKENEHRKEGIWSRPTVASISLRQALTRRGRTPDRYHYRGDGRGNHRPSAAISPAITLHGRAWVGRAGRKGLVKRSLYGERDHAFGKLMLAACMATGLTQAGLADMLGVARH